MQQQVHEAPVCKPACTFCHWANGFWSSSTSFVVTVCNCNGKVVAAVVVVVVVIKGSSDGSGRGGRSGRSSRMGQGLMQ